MFRFSSSSAGRAARASFRNLKITDCGASSPSRDAFSPVLLCRSATVFCSNLSTEASAIRPKHYQAVFPDGLEKSRYEQLRDEIRYRVEVRFKEALRTDRAMPGFLADFFGVGGTVLETTADRDPLVELLHWPEYNRMKSRGSVAFYWPENLGTPKPAELSLDIIKIMETGEVTECGLQSTSPGHLKR